MPIVPVGDPVVGPTITWREAVVVPTKDATGTIFTFNNGGGAGSPLTQSYEVSAGTDRVLVARVLYYHPTTRDLTVTYGGQALTRHGFARYAENNAGDYAEIWYLVNPPVGTANLVLTSSASGAAMAVAVDAWTGVDQTTPFRAATANTGDSSSPGLSGISAQAGDVVLDILGSYANSDYTLTSNQTLDVKNEAGNFAHSLGASRKTATDASESVSWSLSTSAAWWYVAAALVPAAASVGESGALTAAFGAGSAFSGQVSAVGSMSSGMQAGEAFTGRAVVLAAIVEALEAGDTDAAAQAAAAALAAQVETDAQYAAIAQAAAAIQAGIAAGEAWASLAATEAGLVAGAELGASWTGDTQGAQSAALIAGTEAAGQFLGAVAAFALLQSGASASDAFAAASSVSASVTSGTALGASFDPVTGDSTVLVDAMAVQSVFLAAASAVSGLSAEADFDDAYEAISVALSAIASGVILGATFFATSTADVSIVGAAASVRAIRRMGASVRVIRPRATIN